MSALNCRFRSCLGLAALIAASAGSGLHAASDGAVVPVPAARVLELKAGSVNTAAELNVLTAKIPLAGDRHYVVQLTGPMTPQRQAALEASGVRLGECIPQNAYIVMFDGTTPAALAGLGFVAWTGEFRASWKIDPELGVRTHVTPERRTLDALGTPQVVVVSFDGEDVKPIVDEITRLGGVAFGVNPCGGQWLVDARLPLARVAELAGLEQVQYIEDAPEGSIRNDSNRWILQSNVVNSTPVWDKGIHGEGQMGGLIDGTIRESHCLFDDSVAVGPTHRKIVAMRNIAAEDGHGTHTAGTFVGDGAPFDQYTTNDGMAFAAKLSFSEVGAVYFKPSSLNGRLSDAHTDGARVHSNSWGDDATVAYTTWSRAIDLFTYAKEDDVVAFAVSNGSVATTPENAINVLAVGASQDTPLQNSFCSGGTGPTSDGRRKPEIYAPGCNTTSADAGTDCGFTPGTGTSMACPAVSGCGLLVRQYFTEGWYPSGTKNSPDAFTPSGALIRAVLLNSTVDMTGISGYPSNQEGWGRLLLDNALYFAGDARRLWTADVRNAVGLSTGQQASYTVIVNSSAVPLKVTLVSTHPSAAINSANPIVNNLDLQVMAPANNLYLGNVFSGGQSGIGGNADAKNTVEQVVRTSPAAGVYTITVSGTTVNGGTGSPFTQGYALVVSGDVSPCSSPAIADLPESVLIHQGQPVTLAASASGTANLTYQWRKDTVDIDGATSDSYTIPATDFPDTGVYSVVVTNPCGSTTSTDTALSVLCPADFDSNMFVNGDDADFFYVAFFNGDIAADFNGDTFVTGDDADAFYIAFFNGC